MLCAKRKWQPIASTLRGAATRAMKAKALWNSPQQVRKGPGKGLRKGLREGPGNSASKVKLKTTKKY